MKIILLLLFAAVVFFIPIPIYAQQQENSVENENKELVRAFFNEVFNKHNVTAADKYISINMIQHALQGQVPQGLEGFKSFNGKFLAAFPDLHGDFDFLLAEGDMVVGFSSWNGTHKGEFLGYSATDNPVSYRVADL
jgi:predicted ester cyclase